MMYTPYLVVRGTGNIGLVQPGRVVGGNNFIPLGNPFGGLEHTALAAADNQAQQRITTFGDDILLWQQNNIRRYNPNTEDWDVIYTVANQDSTDQFGNHTGLHHMRDIAGNPILIGVCDHNTISQQIRIKYAPDSMGNYVWTQTNIGGSNGFFANEVCTPAIVYQNHLYKVADGNNVWKYDPTSDLIVLQTWAIGGIGAAYTAFCVFKDRLFLLSMGADQWVHELSGGKWILKTTYTGAQTANLMSLFEHRGNLYMLYGENSGFEDGWRFYRINNLDTWGRTNLDSLIPANWRFNSGTERGAPNTMAPNWNNNARSFAIVDQANPSNPKTLILLGSGAATYTALTAFEFVDETAPWTELIGGNLTGEMFYPNNIWGGGAYHWNPRNLNIRITDIREISNTEQEIDFVAHGDPGNPDKIVRIYYDNEQERPELSATLTDVGPVTTGVTVSSDTEGDFVVGVDADGSTIYTVVRDFVADGSYIGNNEVLMPYIERP